MISGEELHVTAGKPRLGEGKRLVNVTCQVNGRIGLEPKLAGSSDPSRFLPGSFRQRPPGTGGLARDRQR